MVILILFHDGGGSGFLQNFGNDLPDLYSITFQKRVILKLKEQTTLSLKKAEFEP
jgi:hypothetical protein